MFFKGLDDGLGASASLHGDGLFAESESLNGVLATNEIGSINEDGVHITDVDNNDAFTVIGAVVDPCNSSTLNQISEDLV